MHRQETNCSISLIPENEEKQKAHLSRRKKVLEGEVLKGSVIFCSNCQVSVFHTHTLLSSDWILSAHVCGGDYRTRLCR
jgi:heterodisulfide reductase subunit B